MATWVNKATPVDTIRRARNDGMLPAGTAEQAKLLHHMYVDSMMPDPEAHISPQVAVQYVCLAYRLAWLISQTAHPRDNSSSLPQCVSNELSVLLRSACTSAMVRMLDDFDVPVSLVDEEVCAPEEPDVATSAVTPTPAKVNVTAMTTAILDFLVLGIATFLPELHAR
jgi:hypothetical protein